MRMRFGNFLAPFHPVGQNPTLAIERDLDLIVAMDRLGFDEAWIGEHHSAGFEIIASRSSSASPRSAPSTSSSEPASARCRTTTP